MPRRIQSNLHSPNQNDWGKESRRRPQLWRTATGLAVALVASAVPALLEAAPANATPIQQVTFHGYRITVPATWPVIDLAKNPATCVRFDQHAVYLGHPGPATSCPTHLVGRTEALLLELLDQSSQPRVTADTVHPAPEGVAISVPPRSASQEVTVAADRAGVLVTASWGTDLPTLTGILAGATLVDNAEPTTQSADQSSSGTTLSPSGTRSSTTGSSTTGSSTIGSSSLSTMSVSSSAVAPGTFSGKGFDACTAPSSATLQAWLASPYRAVGVYIGGVNRACAQPNLTDSWVSTQASRGWKIVPIYVGLQAPCSGVGQTISPGSAWTQGRAAADDAATRAQAVGISPGSALYNDMEHYPDESGCSSAVVSFLNGWTQRLHQRGYASGVYATAFGGAVDLAAVYHSTSVVPPDFIWFARWDGITTLSDKAFSDDVWSDHQRMKQYTGGHDETYGGVTINIDSNVLDVSAGGPPAPFPAVEDPIPVVVGDQIHLFAQGATGELLETVYQPTTGWSTWIPHPGITIASKPSAVVENGNIHLFVRAANNQIYQTDYQMDTGWSGWTSLGGVLAGDPATLLYNTNQIHIFARATNGAIYQRQYTPTTGWSGWTSLGGVLAGDPATLLYNTNQ
ncbi:MAG TPA: glycoside hydrolase domain-containing protein, partial [Mycobacteriales bacterium]